MKYVLQFSDTYDLEAEDFPAILQELDPQTGIQYYWNEEKAMTMCLYQTSKSEDGGIFIDNGQRNRKNTLVYEKVEKTVKRCHE